MQKQYAKIVGNDNPEDTVLRMVVFFDILGRPVKYDEIQKYLEYSGMDGSALIDVIVRSGMMEIKDGYVFIKGREGLIDKYLENEQLKKRLEQKVKRFVPLLNHIPFIRAVAVCNNLAFGNIDEKSDIDLFILTEKGRIFTARIISTLLFYVLGVRRHGGKITGRFCLSFYAAGNDFNLEDIALKEGDIYLHYWARYLRPVTGASYLAEFMNNNADFLNIKHPVCFDQAGKGPGIFQRSFEKLLRTAAGGVIEEKLKKWHVRRLLGRKDLLIQGSGVRIDETVLKFHNKDRRKEYAERFKSGLEDVLNG